MRIKVWLTGLAAALAGLAACLGAQPAAAAAFWPSTAAGQPIQPAQPLIQAPRVCAPNVVYLNRRCRVTDFVHLGQTPDGHDWYYAFYTAHWADRHGRMDRGFPVIFYLQGPATLRRGLWINDEPGLAGRWATTPPVRPLMIHRPEATYLAFTLKAIRDPDDQRLFRQNKQYWKEVDIEHHSDADEAKLAAVMHGCTAADDGFYDWVHVWYVLALWEPLTHAPCGYITSEVAIVGNKVTLTSAIYHPQAAKPAAPPAASILAPALTSSRPTPNSAAR